eukprot:TRINITY_DN3532_c0_g1_i1.p1 TRINITY_DN3532_c0_g1~~TRINITY_DN3532_c0_g1_i1.p1  ORF type:complete len:343 (-),score=96.27 TRINITY_DN3532_c0_g1_i1:16-1044(-)
MASTSTKSASRHTRTGSDPQGFLGELEEKKHPFSWVVRKFLDFQNENPEVAPAVSAVRALTELIKLSKANTMMELEMELKKAVDLLKNSSNALSVSSGCELFARFVSRISGDVPRFEECRKTLIERGEQYTKQSASSREKISKLAASFIRDGATVLTHGFSRVVLNVLLAALHEHKKFSVIVTEARPDLLGHRTAKLLQDAHIPVTIVTDSAVAHIMDRIDVIFVGAEGIVENGGIVNKTGTYQMALVAAAHKKPFYVAAESFKFMRVYPLNQNDTTELHAERSKFHLCEKCSPEDTKSMEDVKFEMPTDDYTPPERITLLFTELGILTPSAVSDELIKLYY